MGCHTWFYQKSNLKIEDAREKLIKILEREIEFNQKLIDFYTRVDLPFCDIFKDDYKHEHFYTSEKTFKIAQEIFGEEPDFLELIESYPTWNIDYCKKTTEIYKRQMRMIKKGLCNCAVFNKMDGVFVDNNYYTGVNEFHDVFRRYGYPNDFLYSYEETMDYIKDPKNGCKIYDYTEERLKEFWEKYPDGNIHFG